MRKIINNIRLGLNYFLRKDIDNQYIDWLSLANAGMLHKGNLFCMDYAIKNLPTTNPIIEIGSFCGLSTNVISYLLRHYNLSNKFFNCDKWVFEGTETGGIIPQSIDVSFEDYNDFVKASYIRNINFFSNSNKPFTIEEYSDDFFSLWEQNILVKDIFNRNVKLGGNISFCYIDGNHSYDYVKRDFENTDRFLDIGGFILFDDSDDTNPFGLLKLMKEVKRMKNYRLIIKNPNYLFQKIF